MLGVALTLSAMASTAMAQEIPPVSALPGPLRPPSGPAPTLPSATPEPEARAPDAAEPARTARAPLAVPPGGPGLTLQGVRFEGGGDLPKGGLDDIVAPFLGQWVTLADLEELRFRLTKHYVDQGYVNSGVILKPGQIVTDGVITFQIIAGRIDEIRVSGNDGLRSEYIQGRIRGRADEPFNRERLQERFQLLLQDPLIDQINGTLLPGDAPGSAVLDLVIHRARPWGFYLRADNYRPPSTGAERFYAGGVLRNVTGFGDALDFYVGYGFEGQGREGAISFAVPVTRLDTLAYVRYSRNDASLIEEPLVDLDIESKTQRFELGIYHPVVRSLEETFNLGLFGSWSENETTLLGEPFSFSEGAVSGQSRVSALRLFQEYSRQWTDQAFAVRSVFSLGLDAFDATINPGSTPDSRFLVWLC